MYNLLQRVLCFFLATFGTAKQKNFLRLRSRQNYESLDEKVKIWIHASSVGEVNLIDGFVKQLLEKREGRILLTVFTDTGFAQAKQKYESEKRMDIFYFPLDLKKEIKSILAKTHIEEVFLVETEIWKNLIHLASQRARIILINGRISDRSYPRYQSFSFFFRPLFQSLDAVYAQTEEDQRRFCALGVSEEKVLVSGNLKFDISFPEYSQEEMEEFRRSFVLEKKKIWVAGSTRTGEYDILVSAWEKVRERYQLVLVPRHLERIPEIEQSLRERGDSYQKYSEVLQKKNKEDYDILLVDAMGVLRKLYASADLCFVGGTLVNIGGHSLLEPLAYKKALLFGPYTQNVKEIAKEILERNLGYQISTVEEICDAIEEIENSSESKREEAIERFLEENQRVALRILEREERCKIEKKK